MKTDPDVRPRSRSRKVVTFLAKLTLGVCLMFIGLLTACQSSLIYFPRPYEAGEVTTWSKGGGATLIDYRTEDGPQQAYLLSTTAKPEHLWFVCGGNGTVALEWSDWIRKHGPPGDAWLLVDMPGYGACGGSPSPRSIRRTVKAVVPAAAEALHWSPGEAQSRLRFFGHSLGCAICLEAAREYDIREGVLLSPFTSTMDMARAVTGLPLGWLVWHRFDNLARLREIEAKGRGRIFILHGQADEVIPVRMSRELAAAAPHTVQLIEVPGGHHNTLQEIAIPQIEKALKDARDAP